MGFAIRDGSWKGELNSFIGLLGVFEAKELKKGSCRDGIGASAIANSLV